MPLSEQTAALLSADFSVLQALQGVFSIKNEKIPHKNPDLKLKKTSPNDLAILAA